jgi:hypothetical protein
MARKSDVKRRLREGDRCGDGSLLALIADTPMRPYADSTLQQGGLKDLRRVRKFKTSLREFHQYFIHHIGNPAALR